jgi:[ribosomal protein S5]-alanine N-acetyltransferase
VIAIPIIESERLLCIPMSLKFANEVYLSWLNDEEVNKYLEVPKENKLTDLTAYIKNAVENHMLFWAIIIKENNKHIGNIKIDPLNLKHGFGEYGILMGDKSEWGKGYAKESSTAVIEYCFQTLGLRKVNLGLLEKNEAAFKLYKSLNFVTEGVYKKHVRFENEYCDVIRMALFNKSNNYN